MSVCEAVAAQAHAEPPGDRRRSGRWRTIAALFAVSCVGLGVWWLVTTPDLEGGGLASVSSSDHAVVAAGGLDETVYVVPADGTGSSTLAFGLHNRGRLAVELVDVWPTMDEPMCFWQPSKRWFQNDPRYMGVLDERARPAAGAVLAPGTSATVWVTGAHPDPGGCVHGGLNLYDDVEVIVRSGGRTTSTRVPLGYTFGYTDDPESLREFYSFQVLPPRPSTVGG